MIGGLTNPLHRSGITGISLIAMNAALQFVPRLDMVSSFTRNRTVSDFTLIKFMA